MNRAINQQEQNIFHQHSSQEHKEKKVAYYRRCNICQKRFRSINGRKLYCQNCRQESEVFRFYDYFCDGLSHAWASN